MGILIDRSSRVGISNKNMNPQKLVNFFKACITINFISFLYEFESTLEANTKNPWARSRYSIQRRMEHTPYMIMESSHRIYQMMFPLIT